jgi:hypothetical protein
MIDGRLSGCVSREVKVVGKKERRSEAMREVLCVEQGIHRQ